jgi:hypothetical protein
MPEEKQVEDTIRVSFNLPKELHTRVTDLIPWGVKSNFFRKIVEIACNRIDEGGYVVIGAILKGDFDPFQKGGGSGK